MASFNDMTQLKAYLQLQVRSAVKNEVADAVKEVYEASIKSEVYDAYPSPEVYDRRFSLLEEGNIDCHFIDTGKVFSLIITNQAKWNPIGYNPTPTPAMLPELIEYGQKAGGSYGHYDYTYDPNAEYLKPRPFTHKTIKTLKATRMHRIALGLGLVARGINCT